MTMHSTPRQRPPASAAQAETAALAAIALCVALCYSNTLQTPLLMDGVHFIADNPAITDLSPHGLKELFHSYPSRFLGFLSFALNYHFTRLSLPALHLTNIALHALNSMLVYLLARTLLGSEKNPGRIPALAGALFFAAHPVQTQAVTYIYQRLAELGAFFYLAACALFLRALKTGPRAKLEYWTSVICAAAAYYSKENTYSLPFALLAGGYLTRGGNFTKDLPGLIPFALLWIPAGINLAQSETFNDIAKLGGRPDITPLNYFAAQGGVILTYLKLIVWPAGQMLLYDLRAPETLLSARALGGWTAVTLVFGALGYALRRNRPALFGLAFFAISLSIEASFIPLQDLIFEHRLYLPLAGAALIIAAVLGEIKEAVLTRTAAAAVIAALGITAFNRNAVWRDEVSLLTDNLIKAPRRAELASDLGAALIARRDFQAALEVLGAAARIAPEFSPTYANLGVALYYTGDTDGAQRSFKKALVNNPDRDRALAGLGNLFREKGDYKTALDYYGQAYRFNPKNALALVNAGQTCLLMKDTACAQRLLTAATGARPDYARGWLELGRFYYSQNNLAGSAAAYKRGLSAAPDDPRLQQEAAAVLALASRKNTPAPPAHHAQEQPK
ncbi:MAG: tetratricopeptide repeat protein [Elusimicrobiaceae bacterium]|nr:tetratricopeptide repeat protein [Elusimicrobiaceae bacterium]